VRDDGKTFPTTDINAAGYATYQSSAIEIDADDFPNDDSNTTTTIDVNAYAVKTGYRDSAVISLPAALNGAILKPPKIYWNGDLKPSATSIAIAKVGNRLTADHDGRSLVTLRYNVNDGSAAPAATIASPEFQNPYEVTVPSGTASGTVLNPNFDIIATATGYQSSASVTFDYTLTAP